MNEVAIINDIVPLLKVFLQQVLLISVIFEHHGLTADALQCDGVFCCVTEKRI